MMIIIMIVTMVLMIIMIKIMIDTSNNINIDPIENRAFIFICNNSDDIFNIPLINQY